MTFSAKTDADSYLNAVRYEMEKGTWEDPDALVEESETPLFKDYAEAHIEPELLRSTSSFGAEESSLTPNS